MAVTEGKIDSTSEAGDVPSPKMLSDSVLCRTCGYDLRGLAIDAQCPECGAAVAEALKDDTLANAHPAWLRKLVLGCRFYVVGTITTLVLMAVSIFISMVLAAIIGATGGGPTAYTSGTLIVFTSIFGLIATIVAVIGAWLITERNPAARDDSPINGRSIARAGIIAYLIMSPWGMYINTGGGPGAAQNATPSTLVTVLIIIGGLVMTAAAMVGWAAYFHYLSRLFLRLPNRKFAVQARIVMWGYSFSVGVMFLASIAVAVCMQRGISPIGPNQNISFGGIVFMIAGLTSCFGIVGIWIFEIWGIVLHLMLGKRLQYFLGRPS